MPRRYDAAMTAQVFQTFRHAPSDRPKQKGAINVVSAERIRQWHTPNTELESRSVMPCQMNGFSGNRYADFYEFAPVGYVGLDACGIIRALNATGARLLGGQRDHFLGSLFLYLIAEQDRHQFLQHLRDCRICGTGLTELTLLTVEGRGLPVVLDSRMGAPDDSGTDVHYWVSIIDVSERKKAEAAVRKAQIELAERALQLEAANRALHESERRKDEFLAMLGHELRNPLAPIRNAMAIMRKLDAPDSQLRWVRDVVDRQVTQLARLVDDLLDVSRIVQGKLTLRRVPMDLTVVIDQAVETCKPLMDQRHHRFTVSLPADPIRLEIDAARLVQAISNLLSNAAKYTPEGGFIWLTAFVEDRNAVICVRDTGEGIPSALLPRLFDAFTQADRTLDRSQGGLGLGLTIVQKIVELHGGQVEARSEGQGKGSEFVVRLPLDSPTSLPQEASTDSVAD